MPGTGPRCPRSHPFVCRRGCHHVAPATVCPAWSDPRQDAETSARSPVGACLPRAVGCRPVGAEMPCSCAIRAMAPVTWVLRRTYPSTARTRSAEGLRVVGEGRATAPWTYVDRIPSPTVEQSSHQPWLENVLGRRSEVNEPTETTRRTRRARSGRSPKFRPRRREASRCRCRARARRITSSAAASASAGWSDSVCVPSDRLTICAPSRSGVGLGRRRRRSPSPAPDVVSAR